MGLTPEQCVDMAKKYVKESLGAAEGTENTAKLMEYIDKPGAIRSSSTRKSRFPLKPSTRCQTRIPPSSWT